MVFAEKFNVSVFAVDSDSQQTNCKSTMMILVCQDNCITHVLIWCFNYWGQLNPNCLFTPKQNVSKRSWVIKCSKIIVSLRLKFDDAKAKQRELFLTWQCKGWFLVCIFFWGGGRYWGDHNFNWERV